MARPHAPPGAPSKVKDKSAYALCSDNRLLLLEVPECDIAEIQNAENSGTPYGHSAHVFGRYMRTFNGNGNLLAPTFNYQADFRSGGLEQHGLRLAQHLVAKAVAVYGGDSISDNDACALCGAGGNDIRNDKKMISNIESNAYRYGFTREF